MRFDSTLYYHVGEEYPWPVLFDEMHETVGLLHELGFGGGVAGRAPFRLGRLVPLGFEPDPVRRRRARFSDRLRIGQCGVVLPDWHPLRVAEDIAFLDQMTRGRVDFGIAPGINSRACMQFHEAADRRDRARNQALFEESLDVILAALNQDTFSHHGEFYRFPAPGWLDNPMVHDPRFHNEDGELVRMAILPRPYQDAIPIYQMAESPASIERAARRGIGIMSQSISAGRLRENRELYRKTAGEAHGRAYAFGEGLSVMRPTYLAETRAEAERAAHHGFNLLGRWGSTGLYRYRQGMVTADEMEEGDFDLDFFDFQIKHGLLLIGTPDSVSAQIERLRDELDCRHIALFLNIPLLSYEQVTRSLRLFAEEVMPRFSAAPEARAGATA